MQNYIYKDDGAQGADSYNFPRLKKLLIEIKNREFSHSKPYIFDIGCGNGRICRSLHSLGFDAVGLEISETGINIARKNSPNIIFYNNNIYDFNEPALHGKFDIVTAFELIEHLENPIEFLRQAKRYLKPGGYLLLSAPYHGYLKNLILSALNLWDRHFVLALNFGHVCFFSPKTIKQMLSEEGFTDLKFYFTGRFTYCWKSMLCLCKAPL